MKVYVIGDIHFGAMQPWSLNLGEKFTKWFGEQEFEKDSILVQLGDIVETAMSPGKVIDLVYRWSEICKEKFKHTYIIQGNHDFKPWKFDNHSLLEFLNSKNHCTVIDNPSITSIEGLSFIGLPHISGLSKELGDFFNEDLPKEFYETPVDFLFAHYHYDMDNSNDYFMGGGIKTDKFKARACKFGHIHTRIGEMYTGSVYPNKINEEQSPLPRQIACFSKTPKGTYEEDKESSIDIPSFITFKEVVYPNKIEENTSDKIEVFTVSNCSQLSVANDYYCNNYIRGIIPEVKDKKKEKDGINTTSISSLEDKGEIFSSFVSESSKKLDKEVVEYVSELFKNSELKEVVEQL